MGRASGPRAHPASNVATQSSEKNTIRIMVCILVAPRDENASGFCPMKCFIGVSVESRNGAFRFPSTRYIRLLAER